MNSLPEELISIINEYNEYNDINSLHLTDKFNYDASTNMVRKHQKLAAYKINNFMHGCYVNIVAPIRIALFYKVHRYKTTPDRIKTGPLLMSVCDECFSRNNLIRNMSYCYYTTYYELDNVDITHDYDSIDIDDTLVDFIVRERVRIKHGKVCLDCCNVIFKANEHRLYINKNIIDYEDWTLYYGYQDSRKYTEIGFSNLYVHNYIIRRLMRNPSLTNTYT